MEFRKYDRKIRHLISAPFVYMMSIPALILHFFLEIYQAICFPLLGIPLVDRDKYIRIDRHKLKYLSPIERMNCVYCGYTIGLFNYATAIGASTERYWCGIKHRKTKEFVEPAHHKDFVRYGDKKGLKARYGRSSNGAS